MKGRKFFPLVVVAAGLLAYHNSFTGELIHDDVGSIVENKTIRHLWPIWQPLSPPHRHGITVEGRPLINLSLAINYALGGYNVWGYHALNLAVHILAGLTLLGIVRRTLLQPPLRERFGAVANELALATAVLWIVHPLQTEPVTYIIQRAESIAGLFYLLTLYCFIRGVESERPRLWYSLSVIACVSGMASKEVMVSAPLMVLLYDRAFLSASVREVCRRRWPLYLALASAWVLLGSLVVSGQLAAALTIAKRVDLTWWEYLATQPGVILYYLRLSVWPHPLGFDSYVWPIAKTWMSIVPSAVAVVILLGGAAWAWRRNPSWGFVGAWFFLILAPSSSFIPLHEVIYEHRMYLPLAAVVSVAVMGLYSLVGRKSLGVFVAVAIGLGFLTWRRNVVYRNDITIRTDAVSRLPNEPVAHYNLGSALGDAGRFQEAIAQYEQALQLKPNMNMPEVHFSWGLALAGLGKFQEAIGQYEQALRINPDYAQAHSNLGVALAKLGRMPEAIANFEQALRLNPDMAEVHYNLGIALARLGRVPEAVGHWEEALRLKPDFADAHNNLGVASEQEGKFQEAIAQYKQAVQLKPQYAEAHYNLGIALERSGRVKEAIAQYEEALRIRPDYAEAHNGLGGVFLRLDRLQEAIEHFEQALQIAPDNVAAHYNLGVALERAGRIQDAIRQYEKVLLLKPDNAEVKNRLARLRTGH